MPCAGSVLYRTVESSYPHLTRDKGRGRSGAFAPNIAVMKPPKKMRRRAHALALVAVAVLMGCANDEAPVAPDTAEPSTSSTGYPPPRELFGTNGPKLFVMDLASTDIGEIAEPFDFDDIGMSPDATQIVFTQEGGKGSVLFKSPYNDPGAAVQLGEGSEPIFSPDGGVVAATREKEVVVFDLTELEAEAPEAQVALNGDGWDVVGWTSPAAGGNLPRLVAQDGRVIWIADLEGGEVPSHPALRSTSPALAVSPTEPQVLLGGNKPAIVPLGKGEKIELAVNGGPLTLAAWSPDGKTVVARVGEGPSSILLSIDAESGQIRQVPYANDVGDEIVWMEPSGGYFLYEQVKPGKRSELMQCNPDLECQYVISFDDRIRFLGLR